MRMLPYSFENDCIDDHCRCQGPTSPLPATTKRTRSLESGTSANTTSAIIPIVTNGQLIADQDTHELDYSNYYCDETTTTAFSSWTGDSVSQLSSIQSSSFLSFDDEEDCESLSHGEEGVGTVSSNRGAGATRVSPPDDIEDGDALSLLRNLSHSTSYYSAVSNNDRPHRLEQKGGRQSQDRCPTSDADGCERQYSFEFDLIPEIKLGSHEAPASHQQQEDMKDDQFSYLIRNQRVVEIKERACHMLRRESEYKVQDYFARHQSEHNSHSPRSTIEVRSDTSTIPIDESCRSKMLEWAYQVVGYSFPPSETNRGRNHSNEAIQIVSRAFLLVDRIVSLQYSDAGSLMNRPQYKLTCMVCLHLVSKTCGLFGLHESDDDVHGIEKEGITSSHDYHRQNSLSSLASGQTIVSTPDASFHRPSIARDEIDKEIQKKDSTATKCQPTRRATHTKQRRRRPPLTLLSLSGMSVLCQNECTVEQLALAEWNVLEQLNWRLGDGISVADWCSLFVELLDVIIAEDDHSHGTNEGRIAMSQDRRCFVNKVWDSTMANLERIMDGSIDDCTMTLPPSSAAWMAVAQALDDTSVGTHGDVIISTYKMMMHRAIFPC